MRRALVLAAGCAAAFLILGSVPTRADAKRSAGPQTVVVKTDDGLDLDGSFYVPSSSRAPGVLLIHDAGSDRHELDTIAARLNKQGFGVLSIDLRGHGGSKTDRLDWSKLSPDEKQTTWTFAQRDVDAGARWLLGQPAIHSTSLTLVGVRAGCALVARHARDDEKVICVALLAPNASDYGYDVKADLKTLEGLPTIVSATKNTEAERIALEANAAYAGSPYVELFYVSPKADDPLADRQLPSKLAAWMDDKANPKKGR